MGFVKIAQVETPEEAKEIWSSFLDFSKRNQEQRVCEVPEIIENESRIFLDEDQSFVLFAGDKFVDAVSGPGIFVYLDVFSAGECDERHVKKHIEILRGAKPDAFADEIPEGTMPKGILIKRQESGAIPFTFDEASYHDFGRKMDIVLQGGGYFILEEANPWVNYALAEFSREKLTERTLSEFPEEEKKQLALDVENAFEKTLERFSSSHFAYEFLPRVTETVADYVNEELYDSWGLRKGIILKEIEFNSFYPAEQCLPELAAREKARREEAARAQEAKAREEKMQEAKAQEEVRVQQQDIRNQQEQQMKQSMPNPPVQANGTNPQAADYTNDRQNMNVSQNVTVQPPVQGHRDSGQERTIRTGNCNWVKSSMVIQNGKAILTNQRFVYTINKFGTLGNALLNSVTGSDKNFQFPLSEIAELSEGKQGIAPTILFRLKNGQQYQCTFTKPLGMGYDTAEWLAHIRIVMKENGFQ